MADPIYLIIKNQTFKFNLSPMNSIFNYKDEKLKPYKIFCLEDFKDYIIAFIIHLHTRLSNIK